MTLKYKDIDDVKIGDKVRFTKLWVNKKWYDENIQVVLSIIHKRQGIISVSTKDYGEKFWNGKSDNSILISYTNIRKLTVTELRKIKLDELFK